MTSVRSQIERRHDAAHDHFAPCFQGQFHCGSRHNTGEIAGYSFPRPSDHRVFEEDNPAVLAQNFDPRDAIRIKIRDGRQFEERAPIAIHNRHSHPPVCTYGTGRVEIANSRLQPGILRSFYRDTSMAQNKYAGAGIVRSFDQRPPTVKFPFMGAL
jgi:hypothetical protein